MALGCLHNLHVKARSAGDRASLEEANSRQVPEMFANRIVMRVRRPRK